MAFAVVDSHGDLVAAARMDGCHSRVLKHAIRKAQTAAVYERNTLALKRQMRNSDRELLEWGDLGVTTLLIRGFEPLEDAVTYGRELIPLLREGAAQRDREMAAAR